MTSKVSENQYGQPHPSDTWASCSLIMCPGVGIQAFERFMHLSVVLLLSTVGFHCISLRTCS